MAEATFSPAGVGAFDSFDKGVEAQQSMMQRASNLRQSQQMEQLRAQEIAQREALMPVVRAKAQADQISAVASIANNARMEHLRGQAAAVSKTANDEFLDVMQLADFDTKARELAGLQAKYQWMSLITEYKGFIDTLNDERLKAHGSAIADAHMDQQLEASQLGYERAIEVAKIGAGSRQAVAETTAGSRETVAETTAKARAASDATRAAISDENRAARVTLTKVKGLQQSAIQADKDAAKAAAAGDDANAAVYRKHAAEYRAAAEAATAEPPPPVEFKVPGAEDTPAREESPKLYEPPAQPGEAPSFSPSVKKPEDVLSAMQQMVNDGVISADEARATLEKLGFKRKGK